MTPQTKRGGEGEEPYLNVFIGTELRQCYEEIELGYTDGKQKKTLETNAKHICDFLCFVQKYWKVLVRAEFQRIPIGPENFKDSPLLQLVTGGTRKKGVDVSKNETLN